ncbi:hypothetical protein [Thermodesulfobium narugense]|nr:hypothetical protein [Thermodesulfobium narugense]
MTIALTNDKILPLKAFMDVHKKISGGLIKIYSNHYVEEKILEKIIFENI